MAEQGKPQDQQRLRGTSAFNPNAPAFQPTFNLSASSSSHAAVELELVDTDTPAQEQQKPFSPATQLSAFMKPAVSPALVPTAQAFQPTGSALHTREPSQGSSSLLATSTAKPGESPFMASIHNPGVIGNRGAAQIPAVSGPSPNRGATSSKSTTMGAGLSAVFPQAGKPEILKPLTFHKSTNEMKFLPMSGPSIAPPILTTSGTPSVIFSENTSVRTPAAKRLQHAEVKKVGEAKTVTRPINPPAKGALALWSQIEGNMAQRDPAGWAALAQEEFKCLVNTYKPGLIPRDVLEEHMRKYSHVYPVQDESKISDPKMEEKRPAEKMTGEAPVPGLSSGAQDVPSASGVTLPTAQSTAAQRPIQEVSTIPGASATPRSGDQVHRTSYLPTFVPALDAQGNVVMTPIRKIGGSNSSQGITPSSLGAQDITPSTQQRGKFGTSIAASSPVRYSPGPGFPRLGAEPQQKAKDDQTIQIPYPGGPVQHNPYRTLPRIGQQTPNQPRSTPVNSTMSRPSHSRSGSRRGPRPKRLDQGPGASPADIYPEDSPMSGENRARANTSSTVVESRPRADTGTDRVVACPPPDPFVDHPVVNFPVATDFPVAPPTTDTGGMDINPAYVPDWENINGQHQSNVVPQASSIPTSNQPDGFHMGFNPYLGAEPNAIHGVSTNLQPPAPNSGHYAPTGYPYGQYRGYEALSPIPEGSNEQASEYNAYLSVGRGSVEPPRSAALSGISDLPYPSPLTVSPTEAFPSAQATFSQTGAQAQRQDYLAVEEDTMEPDQLDGSRYGLQRYGLGLHRLGDVWMPPKPKPGTRFSNGLHKQNVTVALQRVSVQNIWQTRFSADNTAADEKW